MLTRTLLKFQIGDKARAKAGIYLGDVGTIVNITPALYHHRYVVRFEDSAIRLFISYQLEKV